jgi:2-polyprenyl-3-methyl-5-hydroxy-6-metoxy-1,4-benzoquinol methylase
VSLKNIVKKMIDKLGYECRKKYVSGHFDIADALAHNELENVDKLNKNFAHFKMNLLNDKRFVECIYPLVKEQIKANTVDYLDIGCGSGVLVDQVVREHTSLNANGCDFSSSKISQCNQYYKTDRYFVHDIYQSLKGQYDLITCTEVLEHLESPEKALQNLIAALKPNGRLLVTVPDGRKDTFAGHIHFWSPESFKIFIEKALSESSGREDLTLHFEYACEKNVAIIERSQK